MTDREQQLVELVDANGAATGSCTVARAHRPPGRTHRAFSVLLVDESGRLLLQRRAAGKTRFPLRWANACCGHPAPGEEISVAATRRLSEELGLAAVPLDEVGVYRYQAADPLTGLVEDEHDHVLAGVIPADRHTRPDPAEILELRWIFPELLIADLAARPHRYVPWLPGILTIWRESAAAVP